MSWEKVTLSARAPAPNSCKVGAGTVLTLPQPRALPLHSPPSSPTPPSHCWWREQPCAHGDTHTGREQNLQPRLFKAFFSEKLFFLKSLRSQSPPHHYVSSASHERQRILSQCCAEERTPTTLKEKINLMPPRIP